MRLMFAVVLLSTITFAQQSKNPVTDVLRDTLAGRQKNTVAAIEEMPADKFSAKPTPDQMSFAHLAAHIADANYFFCAKVGDVADPKAEKVTEADSKDKLVAAVKASFDFCGTALAKAEDAKLGDLSGEAFVTRALRIGRHVPGPRLLSPAVGLITTERPRCIYD